MNAAPAMAAEAPRYRQLAGGVILAVGLGSLHAYSVLLAGLEQEVTATRADVSLAYSVAIVSLTAAVLLRPRLTAGVSAAGLAVVVGGICLLGLSIAAAATHVGMLVLGYGCLYGVANGLGYGLFLDRSAAALPRRRGLGMGLVTGAYAAGAMLFSFVLSEVARVTSARTALAVLAIAIAIFAALAALLFRDASTGREPEPDLAPVVATPSAGVQAWHWTIYFLGALGGLVSIGHAAGILRTAGASPETLALAPIIVALGNCGGSIAGGRVADLIPGGRAMAIACALTAGAVLWIAQSSSPGPALAGFFVVGFAYGGLISIIPAALAASYGPTTGGIVFGRVFTAWAAAGLCGPWAAGFIYDIDGSYRWALYLAAGCAAAATILALADAHRLAKSPDMS